MSEHDRRACSLLIKEINDPKSKMQVKRCKMIPEWKVYEESEKVIKNHLGVMDYYYEVRPKVCTNLSKDLPDLENSFQLTHENYEQCTNSLTIQQLFIKDHISDLFTPDTGSSVRIRALYKENRTIMKRNMAAWSKASKLCWNLSFVRSQDEILQEQKKLVTPCVRGRPEWFI